MRQPCLRVSRTPLQMVEFMCCRSLSQLWTLEEIVSQGHQGKGARAAKMSEMSMSLPEEQ